MNSIATSINKDLLAILYNIDKDLNAKLTWKYEYSGNGSIFQVAAIITEEQYKILNHDKIYKHIRFHDKEDYLFDYTSIRVPDDKHMLIISIHLSIDIISSSVSILCNNRHNTLSFI